MANVLLVEDDPVLGRGLNVSLELQGYKVEWVRDLKAATNARGKGHFDLVVLDLGLPDGDGLGFLKNLRKEDLKTPVVILTAKADEDSVVDGLQAGASDYVRKPFGNRELMARLKTALREPQLREHELRYDDLVIQPDRRKALFQKKEIELNRREFEILSHFVRHAESVVSREALLGTLDRDGEIFDRTIDSHVSHLRARLRQAGATTVMISSVYGVGYRLERRN